MSCGFFENLQASPFFLPFKIITVMNMDDWRSDKRDKTESYGIILVYKD